MCEKKAIGITYDDNIPLCEYHRKNHSGPFCEFINLSTDEIECKKEMDNIESQKITLKMHPMDLGKIFIWMKNIEDRNNLIIQLSNDNKKQVESLQNFILNTIKEENVDDIKNFVKELVKAYADIPSIVKKERHYGDW